jgi:branched-chain amino acid aminotransferase
MTQREGSEVTVELAAASRAAIRERPEFAQGLAFIDGAFVPIADAKISILDWGFLKSDVTYDVVHVWNGRFFRLRHHLERFQASVDGLRLKLPHSHGEIEKILHQLLRLSGLRHAYVQVICTRGVDVDGSRDPRRFQNRFIAFAIPFVWIADETVRARGINLHVSSVLRIPPASVNPIYKNFHWDDMIRAIYECYEHGCDLPVLLDVEGNLAEGPGFNVFAVHGGRVTTPGGTCLEGVTRRTALDLLTELNVEAVVAALSPAELRSADEVFLTSTAGGILPVSKIDGTPVGDGGLGPLSSRLRTLYWQRHDEGWEATPVHYG